MPATVEFPKVAFHGLTFARNRVTGEHRAFCSCGWSVVSKDVAEVQARAAVHDLDETPQCSVQPC